MSTRKQQEHKALFNEFGASKRDTWTEKATADLKGADLRKKLTWNTIEGFSVDAMYFREDIEKLPHLGNYPGKAPFVRGNTPLGNALQPWNIAQTFDTPHESELFSQIQKGVQAGQTTVGLCFDETLVSADSTQKTLIHAGLRGIAAHSKTDIQRIVNVIPEPCGIDLYAGLSSPAMMAILGSTGRRPTHTEFDPLGELTRSGTIPYSMTTAVRLMGDAVRRTDSKSAETVIGVSGEAYHNAGASVVEELACVLSTAVEYVSRLRDAGLDIDTITPRMRFTFPVGTRFFMEVAKLRAARLLWARIVKLFGSATEESMKMRMHVRSSWWNQTVKDPYVNMLRATVESMAGAIGGAQSMHTAPFDDVAGTPGEFSQRAARNTQIILQEESQLTQVGDPAAGSYYVEQLTDAVARQAWELFQETERRGGMLKALQAGFIQESIRTTAATRSENISRRKDVIVGTNQYPNLTETTLSGPTYDPAALHSSVCAGLRKQQTDRGDITEAQNAILKAMGEPGVNMIETLASAAATGMLVSEMNDVLRAAGGDTLQVTPLLQFRASQHFETLRAAVENMKKPPCVFLATMGPAAWRRARATFASGFFGAAGLDIKDNIGFDTPQLAAAAAVQEGADIIVACSDDESYRDTVPALIEEIRAQNSSALVVVAGNPADDIEKLSDAGVHSFIHVRTDVGAALSELLSALGIDVQ